MYVCLLRRIWDCMVRLLSLRDVSVVSLVNAPTGERTGCLLFVARTDKAATNTQSVLEMLQRSEVSNPPAYGAKIATTILADQELKALWYKDLETMSGRIRAMRRALYDSLNSNGEM